MENSKNPNEKLENVITDSSLPDLAVDYAELIVDGIIDDGVLKDLPLVGSVVGVIKFGNSIDKHFFAKKLYKFLYEINTVPLEQRIEQIEKINRSNKYQSKVGEMIFELLNKMDSDNKPEIIGRLFKSVLLEQIDYRNFLKLSHIVNTLFYYDLLDLKTNTKDNRVYGPIIDSIFVSELVEGDTEARYNDVKNGVELQETYNVLTEFGRMLILYGMK